MKNFRLDERLIKIIISMIIIICSAIAFEKLLSNFSVITDGASFILRIMRNMFLPFIIGFIIAYLLNPIIKFFETKVLIKINRLVEKKKVRLLSISKPRKKHSRFTAALFTYILLIGLIVWLFTFLMPEVAAGISGLISSVVAEQENFDAHNSIDFFNNLLARINNTFSVEFTYQDIINIVLEPLMRGLATLPDVFEMILTGTVNVAYAALSFFIGLFVSFYMILEKESFQASIVKILMTIFKKPTADMIIHIAKSSHHKVERFFIGKIFESIIVAIIFFIACLFINPPFIVLLTFIVGVTNIIPIIGPWVGGIAVVIIVLIRSPMQALAMGILCLVLQQVDNSLIAPKILGDSTGLKPLDVIFAIFAGGAIFGIPGMILGVPFYAVIKNMVSEIIDRKYRTKYRVDDDEGLPP